MIFIEILDDSESAGYFGVESYDDFYESRIVLPAYGNVELDHAKYLVGAPNPDKVVFDSDYLEGYRHDWENGEKDYWDESSAEEWVINHYVKPVMKYFPDETEWEWS